MIAHITQVADLVGHLYLPIGYEEYVGTYDVIPKTVPQVVQTANKHLSNDINVTAIPYYAVGNESGGNTVTIG